MGVIDDFAQGMLREYNTFARQCVALVAEIGDEERAADCFAMEDLPGVAERLGALRARADAAEQRAEAAEQRADAAEAALAAARVAWSDAVENFHNIDRHGEATEICEWACALRNALANAEPDWGAAGGGAR